MGSTVIGREEALGAVEDLLQAVTHGPAALLIEGEAGIGKTTVWDAGVDAARRDGLSTLLCRGAGAEVRLGYAALTDLLAGVGDDALAGLPGPQRRALGAALLRSGPADGVPPSPRAVATGFLTLLESLAQAGPLVIAVDELQWLDRSSAEVLRFAARRLRGRVGVLAARRNPPDPSPSDELRLRDADGLRVLRLGSLARDDIHRVLREHTGRSFPAPVLTRIDRVAAGNPFVALELARTVGANGPAAPPTLPDSLRELVAARLAGLDADALEALLLAAALTRPHIASVEAVLTDGDVIELLERAEAAEIVTIEAGTVVFTHPLLASGVYASATAPQRRDAHRRLAAVVEGAEERARHMALASVEAVPEVIASLDAAASEARARGAPADAAELLGLALELGADEPERLTTAAESHFAAGDLREAKALAERAARALGPGPERARALGLLGAIRHRDYSYAEAAELLEQAYDEAVPGASRVTLGLTLVYVLANTGRLREAPVHVAAALAEAEGLAEPGLLAETLAVQTMVRCLAGKGIDEAALRRALELEDPGRPTPIVLTPTLIASLLWGWTGRFVESVAALEGARRRCLDHGAEGDLVQITKFCVRILCGAGELERAREVVGDASERAAQLGTEAAQAVARGNEAALAAWEGEVDRARQRAREALALFESIGAWGDGLMVVEALGPLELSVERYDAAAELLVPALERLSAGGGGEPAAPPFAPDAIEALLAIGRIDDARAYVGWLDERAEALGRADLDAVAARCRGLLYAAEGELQTADDELEAALMAHDRRPIPYETARTLLCRGQIQRRRRRRRAARESLERAHDIFESLRTPLWAARCDSELERLGLRPLADPDELTPSERRVAELAAGGLTNREVASTLFISPKTVEANLARVYRKLGIHSRAELGQRMAREREAEAVSHSRG